MKKIAVLVFSLLLFAGCSSTSEPVLLQFQGVKEGDTLAIMETNHGDITIKLFPDEAPKAVENFVTHAEEGYYDGLTFHRVINSFMIQGGDPKGDGTGGESIWGEPFEDEFSDSLYNFNGALSMANSGKNTNGSQFFIVQQQDGSQYSKDTMSSYDTDYADNVIENTMKSVELHGWTMCILYLDRLLTVWP